MTFSFKKSLITLLVLAGLMVMPAYAQTHVVKRTVQGVGTNQSLAIQDAILEAARQIYGVRITSASTNSQSSSAVYAESSEGDFDGELYVNQVNRKIQENVGKKNGAFINGYDLIDVETIDHGQVRATIEVSHNEYRVPGPDNNRRRIVVLGLDVDDRLPSELGYRSADQISSMFEMILVQSRRFAVLDRANPQVYKFEKEYLKQSGTSAAEMARFGRTLGADYVFFGTLSELKDEKSVEHIQISGTTKEKRSASIRVNYQVVAVATQQIKWSSFVEIHIEQQSGNNESRDEFLSGGLDKAAYLISDDVLETIFPPKIVKISGDDIMINRGGVSAVVGDQYDVFRLGEKIVDPDTHESLGASETKTAVLQIREVKPKYSVGTLVSGTIGNSSKGLVLRRVREGEAEKAKAAGDDVERNEQFPDANNNGMPDYLE